MYIYHFMHTTTTTTVLRPFSGTTWVSRWHNGLYGARED